MPIVTIKGEITPDGQLKLPELPLLPAGAVNVTIRTLTMKVESVSPDVAAGRKIDEAATDQSSYDNLPDWGE
jgi:hypothetical protein